MQWGLAHTEVIVTPRGSARLVEVNGRAHNADFLGVCTACVGYNAFQVMADAYFGGFDDAKEKNG